MSDLLRSKSRGLTLFFNSADYTLPIILLGHSIWISNQQTYLGNCNHDVKPLALPTSSSHNKFVFVYVFVFVFVLVPIFFLQRMRSRPVPHTCFH